MNNKKLIKLLINTINIVFFVINASAFAMQNAPINYQGQAEVQSQSEPIKEKIPRYEEAITALLGTKSQIIRGKSDTVSVLTKNPSGIDVKSIFFDNDNTMVSLSKIIFDGKGEPPLYTVNELRNSNDIIYIEEGKLRVLLLNILGLHDYSKFNALMYFFGSEDFVNYIMQHPDSDKIIEAVKYITGGFDIKEVVEGRNIDKNNMYGRIFPAKKGGTEESKSSIRDL